MKRKHSQALVALSNLLQTDFETATRKQRSAAEAAIQAGPSVWTLILAVKDWARALADVCRSHSQKCSEIQSRCNEQDHVTAAMKTLLLALCDHLWLPADPLLLLTEVWPESNALHEFVLQVSGAPIELIEGELVTKPALPRWEQMSSFARRLAGLNSIPPQGADTAFLSVDETQKVLRELEEVFRNALWDSLQASFSEAVLASYGAPAPKPRLQIPPKKQDLSKYLDSARLTDRQRLVLSLHLEHEMNPHQIAQHLGLHHSTIQGHIRAGNVRMTRTAEHAKRERDALPGTA